MAKKLAARHESTGTKCCCDPAIITECRKRSGTAALCGWDEYVLSTPPRRYGDRALSGTVRRDNYPNLYCSGAIGNWSSSTWSGTATKGIVAGLCQVTGAGLTTWTNSFGGTGTAAQEDVGMAGLYSSERDVITTATTRRVNALDVCTPDYGNGASAHVSGYAQETLGDEDTETEAETRAAGAWTDWYLRVSLGCSDCCNAYRAARATGYSFAFQQSQFRLGIEEGPVGEGYTIALDYMRQPIGGGAWVKVATDYFSVTSTEPGLSHDGWTAYPVPQLAGYRTDIDNIRIYNPDE